MPGTLSIALTKNSTTLDTFTYSKAGQLPGLPNRTTLTYNTAEQLTSSPHTGAAVSYHCDSNDNYTSNTTAATDKTPAGTTPYNLLPVGPASHPHHGGPLPFVYRAVYDGHLVVVGDHAVALDRENPTEAAEQLQVSCPKSAHAAAASDDYALLGHLAAGGS
ncbi:hypothetical protein VTK56DRAFT_1203 [Thermocarpiscus australiensis]